MDSTDLKILAIVQEDASLSIAEVAAFCRNAAVPATALLVVSSIRATGL